MLRTAFVLWITIYLGVQSRSPCKPLDFGHGSVVCLCTPDYCDSLEPLEKVPGKKFYHLVSSAEGKRFDVNYGRISGRMIHKGANNAKVSVVINRSSTFQKIIGFGGAFTDAAALNLASVSDELKVLILKAYYGNNGLQYNLGRTNMGSCDFSTRLYSYDDVENDVFLGEFALAEEDIKYKIPLIKSAAALSPQLKMFASPWTAPKWMKTNGEYYGTGALKLEYYQPWANYFAKFLDEYQKRGVKFWAVTAQNEPLDGLLPDFPFNCMGWTPEEQRDWIKKNLGPTLAEAGHGDTKIIILDDQRALVVPWTRVVLKDPEAAKYVSGIGLHWYWDNFPADLLELTHKEFPQYFMLSTEASVGSNPLEEPVILGSWNRAELYAADIIQNLNHWVTGWVDWNLVLDLEGGPNWEKNFLDAPIIVDNVTDRAYKQPMYYAIGHFSKFIPPDSVRISYTTDDIKGLELLVVQRPDNNTVVVALNNKDDSRQLMLQDREKLIEVDIGPHSLHTIVFSNS